MRVIYCTGAMQRLYVCSRSCNPLHPYFCYQENSFKSRK